MIIEKKQLFISSMTGVYMDFASNGVCNLAVNLTPDRAGVHAGLTARFAARAKGGQFPTFKALAGRRQRQYFTPEGQSFEALSLSKVFIPVVKATQNFRIGKRAVANLVKQHALGTKIARWLKQIATAEECEAYGNLHLLVDELLDGTANLVLSEPELVFELPPITALQGTGGTPKDALGNAIKDICGTAPFKMLTPEEGEEGDDEADEEGDD